MADFEGALRSHSSKDFVEGWTMSDESLRAMVEEDNRDRDVDPDDPNAITFEVAKEFIAAMRERVVLGLELAADRVRRMTGADLRSAAILGFEVRKSYWEPPVVDIDIQVELEDDATTIAFRNLGIEEGRPVFGPATGVEVRGYEVQDFVAFQVIDSLKNGDAELYVDNVLADLKGFAALLEAAYETLGVDLSADLLEAYEETRMRLIEDFDRLVALGEEAGIEWERIEMTWSGMSSSLDGEIYQTSIPIQFDYDGTEYRLVLDYCTQLRERRDVFLPGEFRWEGKL